MDPTSATLTLPPEPSSAIASSAPHYNSADLTTTTTTIITKKRTAPHSSSSSTAAMDDRTSPAKKLTKITNSANSTTVVENQNAAMFQDLPPKTRTPDPGMHQQHLEDPNSPGTPAELTAFDWDDFEARYERSLTEADEKEQEILEDFEQLAKYFGIWASTSSAVDNDRATKRLQTRERFVALAEKRTAEKQEHHDRVLRAFQSALALLRQ